LVSTCGSLFSVVSFSYTVRRSIPLFSSQPHPYSCRDPKPASYSSLCRTIAALSHISLIECYSILIPCLAVRSRLVPRRRICIGSHNPICARKLKTSRSVVSVDGTHLVFRRLALQGFACAGLYLFDSGRDWLLPFLKWFGITSRTPDASRVGCIFSLLPKHSSSERKQKRYACWGRGCEKQAGIQRTCEFMNIP
jgi:hypothetical protein